MITRKEKDACWRRLALVLFLVFVLGCYRDEWVAGVDAFTVSNLRRHAVLSRTGLFDSEGYSPSTGNENEPPPDLSPPSMEEGNEQQNEVTTANGYRLASNNATAEQPRNGKALGPTLPEAPTAPEVNKWTFIMSDRFLRSNKKPIGKDDLKQLYQELQDMSEYDMQQVNVYFDRMLPRISYLGSEKCAKVKNALLVAYRAHRGQMRKSGEPFIIHPVEVALLLSDLKMDAETVMSGLLHDTVEDTDLTFAEVEAMFGKVVRSIVEGETKVSKLPKLAFSDYADEQAENLRQMFVAMTDDYRIIIVKLADRLHNMRTLRHMKPHKQIKISRETLDIFAPLAHRMGIWHFKSELEDTAFMYLYPQEYKRLNRRLRLHQSQFRETLDKSQEILRKTLAADRTLKDQAAEVKVYGRTKEIYSLWHKMETKGERNLDHIVDVVALRVIITPKEAENLMAESAEDGDQRDRGVWLCYHVLGLVQHLPGFQPVPTRVKDYISFPKPNGYQSLHTALMLNGQAIEVQIRTSDMHQVAEYGMASHWAYTDGKKRGSQPDLFNTPWLASIKEWQNDLINSRDFVDSVRRELLGKRVFVFLRNGKILNLARGATAIDAAFQIHTEVGLNMHGVEINGNRVPFSYELKNGDVVSILTGGGTPQTDWMRYARIRSTRSKLRSYFRAKQKESLHEAGKILLLDYLWNHGPLIEKTSFVYKNLEVPDTIEGLVEYLPGRTRYHDIDDLLVDIGMKHDRAFLHNMISKIFYVPQNLLADAEKKGRPLIPSKVIEAVNESRQVAMDAAAAAATEEALPDDEMLPGANTTAAPTIIDAPVGPTFEAGDNAECADPEHLCQDCLPVYGDEIIGTKPINGESTPTVHRVGCPHAQRAVTLARSKKGMNPVQSRIDSIALRLMKDNRFTKNASGLTKEVPVNLRWEDYNAEDDVSFMTEIVVIAADRKLLLADCSEIVSELSEIVRTGSVSTKEHATLAFVVKVTSLEHLQKLMDNLCHVRSVMSVERRFGSELL